MDNPHQQTHKGNSCRTPAVAGRFYPAQSTQLLHDLNEFFDHTNKDLILPNAPKAMIVPHAGYMYSGPVAAEAYNLLIPYAEQYKTVCLLGPAHYEPVRGAATSSVDFFMTPLGKIPLQKTITHKLNQLPHVSAWDDAHLQEHSLEVQLPFLQLVLPSFELVPVAVGHCTSEQMQEIVDTLWGDESTLLIISSDLSHYLDYTSAQQLDQETSASILNFQEDFVQEQACGSYVLNGFLPSAKEHELSAQCVALNNSGDTAGDKNRVVGYGAYVFY